MKQLKKAQDGFLRIIRGRVLSPVVGTQPHISSAAYQQRLKIYRGISCWSGINTKM